MTKKRDKKHYSHYTSAFLTFALHLVKSLLQGSSPWRWRILLPIAGLEWDMQGYKDLTTIPFLQTLEWISCKIV